MKKPAPIRGGKYRMWLSGMSNLRLVVVERVSPVGLDVAAVCQIGWLSHQLSPTFPNFRTGNGFRFSLS